MHLFDIVKRACYQNFHQHVDKILADLIPEGESVLKDSHMRCLFFGNYMEPDADPKIYDEVSLSVLATELHKRQVLNITCMCLMINSSLGFSAQHFACVRQHFGTPCWFHLVGQ
jgi:hypothetical protein